MVPFTWYVSGEIVFLLFSYYRSLGVPVNVGKNSLNRFEQKTGNGQQDFVSRDIPHQ